MIEKDKEELSQSIPRWIKMMEELEKGSDANRNEVSKLLAELSNGLKNSSGLKIPRVFHSKERVVMSPSGSVSFKFLYEKRMTKSGSHVELQRAPFPAMSSGIHQNMFVNVPSIF